MNDNIDEWLNQLGFTSESPATPNTPAQQPDTQQPQSLSNEDFDDILGDFGFSPSEDAQAEEITEEVGESGEDVENTDSPVNPTARDLDAEEDADWQEAIDSGSIVPVVGPNNQRVSITEEEASQINAQETVVEDNQVHFHMPDGEVIDVPIVTEEQNQEPHELEQAAIEAQQAVVEAPQQQEALIPLNSPTLLLDESTTRFSGAEWFNEIQRKNIIVAGQGGIGSNLSFQLARMHPASMVLYDDDMVETVNMAGQLYARNDIGKSKVAAISDMITSYTNMQNIYAIKSKFTENTEAGDIMMCGFDNMEARKIFYTSWHDHVMSKPVEERKNCLFLDGRLSMTDLQVFCITGDDAINAAIYRDKYLFSDSEAEHTVCSMKQTTYLACMIGSIMTNLFTNWAANLLDPIIPYDLPFFTEYDAQNMIFKTVK